MPTISKIYGKRSRKRFAAEGYGGEIRKRFGVRRKTKKNPRMRPMPSPRRPREAATVLLSDFTWKHRTSLCYALAAGCTIMIMRTPETQEIASRLDCLELYNSENEGEFDQKWENCLPQQRAAGCAVRTSPPLCPTLRISAHCGFNAPRLCRRDFGVFNLTPAPSPDHSFPR